MFRFLFSMNVLGRYLAEILIVVLGIFLFFPALCGVGILGHAQTGTFTQKYFTEIFSLHLVPMFTSLGLSFLFSFLCVFAAVVVAWFTHKSFAGKSFFTSLCAAFLFLPSAGDFLLIVPFFQAFSKAPWLLAVQGAGIIWGFMLGLLLTWASCYRLSQNEIQAAFQLGGNQISVLKYLIFPRMKKTAIYLSLLLGAHFFVQGSWMHSWSSTKIYPFSTLLWAPANLYANMGLSSAAHLIAYLIALIGTFFGFMALNPSFESSKTETPISETASSRKRVTRKSAKKGKASPKKEKKAPDANLLENSETQNSDGEEKS